MSTSTSIQSSQSEQPELSLAALRMWDRVVRQPLSRVACGRPIRRGLLYGIVIETALGENVRFQNGVRVRWTDGSEDTLSALVEVDTPVGAIS